ncbi:MAG: hypothetical protein VR64_08845 [Desulfatitalea sp. BRH_c12]|nr:MAG: hypothetical protein VR64_08845 [Desulfatitalea sp. BRH_c12]
MPIFRLSDKLAFPPPHLATKEGLLAVGGDLQPERLLLAYKNGIFPWYSEGDPILWWSPDPRLVLYPEEINVSKSLRRTLRRNTYQITIDTAFARTIDLCARIRIEKEGTWITQEMTTAYCLLHDLGFAHSVEAWHAGELVGGLYGIALGRAFFGESMFSLMSDASKVCLVHLARFLNERHFAFIDCQVPTEHLVRMGARNISRKSFIVQLRKATRCSSLKTIWAAEKHTL